MTALANQAFVKMNGTGNEIKNVLTGNAGDNVLSAGDANDTLFGAAGDDILIGGAGDDRMKGGVGNDTVHDYRPGQGTNSATPLAWTHAEYIKLLRSTQDAPEGTRLRVRVADGAITTISEGLDEGH